MIVIGFILVGLAVAAALVLVLQNLDPTITVHALGQTWTNVHGYWALIGGIIIGVVGMLGLAGWAAASRRARVLRRERNNLARERNELARENERLSGQVASTEPVVARDPAADMPPDNTGAWQPRWPETTTGAEGYRAPDQ